MTPSQYGHDLNITLKDDFFRIFVMNVTLLHWIVGALRLLSLSAFKRLMPLPSGVKHPFCVALCPTPQDHSMDSPEHPLMFY